MLLKLLTVSSCALAWAIGVAASTYDHDLEWISTNASLPKVVIYNTGGTILSASNYSRLDNVIYGAGQAPKPVDLIGNMTEVLSVAQLAVVDFPVRGGSAVINSSMYLNISRHANRHLCSPASDIAGAIMFHGTNTLEETAFGVDLTFNCSKPFVATGAMRPATYISPDGPSNFFQAVAAAASPWSRDRGGLIAFNDRITSIFYSTKLNANTPDTFKAPEQGNLGVFLAGQPYYFFAPAYPTGRPYFDLGNTTELPAVVTLYSHQGFDASLMYAAVANGAKGLVILGPGAAQLTPEAKEVAADLYARGVPTVVVPRPVTGTGVPDRLPGPVFRASYVGADQARIMLQLALNAGYSLDQIRDFFESHMRQVVYEAPVNQEFYYPA